MTSWVEGAEGSLFDVDNLPYGVFSRADQPPRIGVRIGEHVLDLAPLAAAEMLDTQELLGAATLNPLLAGGSSVWRAVRRWVTALLTAEAHREFVEPFLVPLGEPSKRQMVVPLSRPPTWIFHITQPLALYQWKRSPGVLGA